MSENDIQRRLEILRVNLEYLAQIPQATCPAMLSRMPRFFNTAGVCEPRDHYMVPPRPRLPDVGALIDQKAYFVVHAPRQSGKTTCFHHLARELTAEGRYAALLTSCETARTAGDDVDRGGRSRSCRPRRAFYRVLRHEGQLTLRQKARSEGCSTTCT